MDFGELCDAAYAGIFDLYMADEEKFNDDLEYNGFEPFESDKTS